MACHQAALFVLISYQIVSHGATSPGQNFKIQRVAVIGAESAQNDPHSKNLNRSGDLKYYTLINNAKLSIRIFQHREWDRLVLI